MITAHILILDVIITSSLASLLLSRLSHLLCTYKYKWSNAKMHIQIQLYDIYTYTITLSPLSALSRSRLSSFQSRSLDIQSHMYISYIYIVIWQIYIYSSRLSTLCPLSLASLLLLSISLVSYTNTYVYQLHIYNYLRDIHMQLVSLYSVPSLACFSPLTNI